MSFFREHADRIFAKIPNHRIVAVDVFRGIAITAMILVNNPGSWSHSYAPLKHAQWHGWTPTDLIFPFFVFIVGISISLSMTIKKGHSSLTGHDRRQLIIHSAIRMIKLLLLGWFLALFFYRFGDTTFSWTNDRLFSIRIMGVLQRIGLVYFTTTVLFLYFRPILLALWALALLIIYGLSMSFIPYSDGDGMAYQGLWLEGNNLTAWIDHHLLGSKHVYAKTAPFTSDPEGLFSTIPAISTCITGVLAGLYIQQGNAQPSDIKSQLLLKQVKTFIIIGVIGVILGQLLSDWIPINKSLWTPSYVLLSSGLACITLAICIYLIDIKKHRQWSAPFIVFGANSIAFFMFSGIVGRLLVMIPVGDLSIKAWLYQTIYQSSFGDIRGSLAFALSFLVLSYFVMHWMYRKNIFWKV